MFKRFVSVFLVVLILVFTVSVGSLAAAVVPPPNLGNYAFGSISQPLNISGAYSVSLEELHAIMRYCIGTLKTKCCITAVPTNSTSIPYAFVIRSLDKVSTAVLANTFVVYCDASDFTPEGFTYSDQWFYYVAIPVEASTGIFTGSDASYVASGVGGGGFSSGGGGGRGGSGQSERPQYSFTFPSLSISDKTTADTTNVSLAPYDVRSYLELWFQLGLIKSDLSNCTLYTERDLRDICDNLNKAGVVCEMVSRVYKVGSGKMTLWTIKSDYNPDGFAYGYRACEFGTGNFMIAMSGVTGSASESKEYYTDGTSDGDKIINNTGNTNNGKVLNLIDGTYYDYSSDTWTVADEIIYNTENNNYQITNNNQTYNYYYTYNYTYNITIGSSGQYTEIYNYFELPDGRNSYDLTAADIAPLSMEFDAINYDREALDTHTKLLCHFDGDLNNSAFYSDYSLSWTDGASITYLESTNFNGCLYLDDASHSIKLNLADDFNSDNGFTLQFRYYVPPGGGPDMWFGVQWSTASKSQFDVVDGALRLKRGTKKYLPVGQWCDIAFCGDSSGTRLYLNGVLCAKDTSGVLGSFWFQFASTAGTFCYIDEMRVVDYMVYTENFTPTPVPYDTNNVFVLPEFDVEPIDKPIVAVRSDVPISGYQFGGVRPTFPAKGLVWFNVEDYVVKGSYQYNGAYWEDVGTRIWTGSRWIPLYSYNFELSQDEWDSADVPYTEEMITSQTGFYSWFKTEWVDFRNWLMGAFAGLGSGGTSPGTDDKNVIVVPGDPETGDDGFSLLDIVGKAFGSVVDVLGGLFSTCLDGAVNLTGPAMDGLTDSYGDDADVWQFFYYEGNALWD